MAKTGCIADRQALTHHGGAHVRFNQTIREDKFQAFLGRRKCLAAETVRYVNERICEAAVGVRDKKSRRTGLLIGFCTRNIANVKSDLLRGFASQSDGALDDILVLRRKQGRWRGRRWP